MGITRVFLQALSWSDRAVRGVSLVAPVVFPAIGLVASSAPLERLPTPEFTETSSITNTEEIPAEWLQGSGLSVAAPIRPTTPSTPAPQNSPSNDSLADSSQENNDVRQDAPVSFQGGLAGYTPNYSPGYSPASSPSRSRGVQAPSPSREPAPATRRSRTNPTCPPPVTQCLSFTPVVQWGQGAEAAGEDRETASVNRTTLAVSRSSRFVPSPAASVGEG